MFENLVSVIRMGVMNAIRNDIFKNYEKGWTEVFGWSDEKQNLYITNIIRRNYWEFNVYWTPNTIDSEKKYFLSICTASNI